MRIPSWILVPAAVLLALPAGWGVGVLLAYAGTGGRIGQLPALTVPLSIVGAIVFALWSPIEPRVRFSVLASAAGACILIGLVAARM